MNIWIANHYATSMYFNRAGRHFWFAEELCKRGHNVTIFCSNIGHNGGESVNLEGKKYKEIKINDIRFIFVKTSEYSSNSIDRIKNMVLFFLNFKKTAIKLISNKGEIPDIIIASSVHPLTLLAGEQLSRKYNIPCICEIRDLWPESLVEEGLLSPNSVVTGLLYSGEKYIYEKANALIFTFKDGYKYIVDKKWDSSIDANKVFYINNGIKNSYYIENINNSFEDADLNNDIFKAIYVGAIGEPNKVDLIINAAETIEKNTQYRISFLIYGDGIQRKKLEAECEKKNLKSIKFKGLVERSKIPYILSHSNVNLLTVREEKISKYGLSMNKLFDYLAAGKPIVSNNPAIRSVIGSDRCGIVDKTLTDGIIEVYTMSQLEYETVVSHSRKIAESYDYKVLTDQLLMAIKKTIEKYHKETRL